MVAPLTSSQNGYLCSLVINSNPTPGCFSRFLSLSDGLEKGHFMPEYQLYCFAQSGNAYRAALMLKERGVALTS